MVRDLGDLRGLRVTRRSFTRPANLDLRSIWHDHVAALEQETDAGPDGN